MSSIAYRPEIDGLRAFAIATVVLFHLLPGVLPGGFLGVDIFFVISGYLITSIILADRSAGRFTLRDFWARRIRRILPAAAFVLAVVLLAALLLDYPQRALSTIGRQAAGSLALAANFGLRIMVGDYWAPASEDFALLHLWSLAVEEQFYLIYPLLAVALLGLSRRLAVAAFAALGLASLVFCLLAVNTDPSAAFFFPQYRAWEILAGCVLAFLPSLFAGAWMSWTGAGVIIAAIALSPLMGPSPGLASILAVAGACLFIAARPGSSAPTRVASHPAIVTLGKASYSLYLWHWPCIVMTREIAGLLERPLLAWLSIPIMVAGTWISYSWIEKWGRSLRSPYVFAVLTVSCLMAFSIWAAGNEKIPATPGIEKPTWLVRAYDCVQAPSLPLIGEKNLGFIQPDPTVNPRNPRGHVEGVLAGAPGATTGWFLTGDSHALMWASQLDRLAKQQGKSLHVFGGLRALSPLLLRHGGSGLTDQQREQFNEARLAYIDAKQPEIVFLAMRWGVAHKDGELPLLDELVTKIHELSPRSRIILFSQLPLVDISVNSNQWVAWRMSWGMDYHTAPMAEAPEVADANAFLRSVADRYPFVQVADFSQSYVRQGRILMVEDKKILFRDDDHVTEEGAIRACPELLKHVSVPAK